MSVLRSIARNTAKNLKKPGKVARTVVRDVPKIPGFTRAAFRGGYRKTKDTATGWRRE